MFGKSVNFSNNCECRATGVSRIGVAFKNFINNRVSEDCETNCENQNNVDDLAVLFHKIVFSLYRYEKFNVFF